MQLLLWHLRYTMERVRRLFIPMFQTYQARPTWSQKSACLHKQQTDCACAVKPAVDLGHLQALATEARQSQQWQSAVGLVQDLFYSPETLAISFMPPCAAVRSLALAALR